MKRKIAIGLESVVVVLVAATLLVLCWPAADPPLRQGMTAPEVSALLGPEDSASWSGDSWKYVYRPEPDGLGNRQVVYVTFDDDRHVVDWNARPLSRDRPPWLDRTVKAMGL